MHIAYLSMIAGGLALWTAPASAQTQAAPTVEGYLCTFAGKCGDVPEAEQPTRVAPPTKGFRIAKSGGEPATAVRKSPRVGGSGYVARTPRPGVTAASGRRSPTYTGGRRVATARRADLMIGFDLNSARITPGGMASARIFAKSLQMPELRSKRFLIEGHTDALGGLPFNMDLSRRRAEAVADFLAQEGVERSRIEIQGFGPNDPLPGRRKSDRHNRRVEAKLIS